jgi:hypothetical protein
MWMLAFFWIARFISAVGKRLKEGFLGHDKTHSLDMYSQY